MPTTESLLHAWGQWSRVEINIGPDDTGCGSVEGMYRSPQPWDGDTRRRPRLALICDDEAMRVEKCVIGTGSVLAACLRAYFIRQHPPRRHAEVAMLHEAIRRCGELLSATEQARNRPRRDAEDGHAMSPSPQSL